MPKHANRVAETSTTTGTGTMTLAGAITGHQSFGTAFGTGGNSDVYYGIRNDAGDWEVGIGTYLGVSNALQRDIVLDSSNSGSKVSFPSGSKTVYEPLPAEPSLRGKAWRATDVPLMLLAAAAQSANIMETYKGDSSLGPVIDSAGNLKLSPNTNEMVRLPMDTSTAGFISTRRDPLSASSPAPAGIRHRLSGTGTTGVVQWSEGDDAYVQMQPSARELSAADATNSGVNFAQGIVVKGVEATMGSNDVGHVSFDCNGTSGNTVWDIGPVNHTAGQHSVRIGRRASGSATVRFIVLSPGSATSSVEMHSDGYLKAGEYYVGADDDGVASDVISREGAQLVFQAGVNSETLMTFRDNNELAAAIISPNGTSSPSAQTVITREKGDVRFAAISSRRFKEKIGLAGKLAHLFDKLTPKRWTWGGEVPEGDERRGAPGLGFIAEEVVQALPEAGRYITTEDGPVLQSLDALALIAVLHAKVRELDLRIAALEGK